MKAAWVIFSKEFLDIIRDRRRFIWMLVSSFVLLPLLFIVPYSFIIVRLVRQSSDAITIPAQGMDNAPALVAYLEEEGIQAIPAENVEELVLNRQYAVGLIIPDDYEERIAGGQSVEVTVVSDQRRSMDVTGSRLVGALEAYGDELLAARLKQRGLADEFISPLTVKRDNAATATETTGSMLGLLIPGVILSIALSTGMPVAISTVAGEKKKLTLEPVLFTTVSRFQLVFAKFLAVVASILLTLFVMAISLTISGVVLAVAVVRSLPELFMSQSTDPASVPAMPGAELLRGGYNLEPVAILLFLLAPLLIIFFSAALQLLVSVWARNDEEAATYLTPLNLFGGAVFLIAFFLDEFIPQLWHYSLPIFGTILSMRDLLSNKVEPASLTVMFLSSAFYALLMLGLAVWMFHREEVVFRT